MNFLCAHIIFSLVLIANLKSIEAERVGYRNYLLPIDTSNPHVRYHRLGTQRLNYYYNLLNRQHLKNYFVKLLKNKNRSKNLRPFEDLTRDADLLHSKTGNPEKFSDDYIDITELARYSKPKYDNKLKLEHNNKVLSDIHGDVYEVLKMLERYGRRMVPYQQRSHAFTSDTDKSSSHSESDEVLEKNKARTRLIPKRFEIIDNNSEESLSDDGNNDDDKTINVSDQEYNSYIDKDKLFQVESNSDSASDESNASDETLYIQSPTRYLKSGDIGWRRRLKHFLPKRVHWTEREMQNLRNYWIDGPRGRYPAHYKTPY